MEREKEKREREKKRKKVGAPCLCGIPSFEKNTKDGPPAPSLNVTVCQHRLRTTSAQFSPCNDHEGVLLDVSETCLSK